MTKELIIVIGMLVLYICSLMGLITAWVYYNKHKRERCPELEKSQTPAKGG